jgi:hypothetical protein
MALCHMQEDSLQISNNFVQIFLYSLLKKPVPE